MRGGLSPLEARRLVGKPDEIEQPCPTRRSNIVARTALGMVVLGLALTMCASPRAAELPIERTWLVWNLSTGTAWTSPRGLVATATNETACSLAMVEATQHSPAGTRLACRKTSTR